MPDGQLCASREESLAGWQEHHEAMHNHAPATPCPDLDREATSASEVPDVRPDAPTIQEVREAIARLNSGRITGTDGILPELLKYATDSISSASFVVLDGAVQRQGLSRMQEWHPQSFVQGEESQGGLWELSVNHTVVSAREGLRTRSSC